MEEIKVSQTVVQPANPTTASIPQPRPVPRKTNKSAASPSVDEDDLFDLRARPQRGAR
ncbi:hypothetical protein HGRIS_004755 [Hohenbuehelia grisea]|uniref:Uncharacterized protein n=1 Tax=Hohenbuehelia grisea TaxID=104357 RepID=A0ABR3JCX7_9AGAR